MAYDPNITQKVREQGNTDSHRLKDLLWRAIENHDDAYAEHQTRLVKLEAAQVHRLTEERVMTLLKRAQAPVLVEQKWIMWTLRAALLVLVIDIVLRWMRL